MPSHELQFDKTTKVCLRQRGMYGLISVQKDWWRRNAVSSELVSPVISHAVQINTAEWYLCHLRSPGGITDSCLPLQCLLGVTFKFGGRLKLYNLLNSKKKSLLIVANRCFKWCFAMPHLIAFISTFVLINQQFPTAGQYESGLSSGLDSHLAQSASVCHVRAVSSHCAFGLRDHPQMLHAKNVTLKGKQSVRKISKMY